MHRFTLLSIVLTLLGCNDYNFHEKDDPPGQDSGDPDTWDSGEPDTYVPGEDCPDLSVPGYATSSDDECANEVATGTFTPVVKWKKSTWSVAPQAYEVMSQPIVCQTTDDDHDGDIDVDDTPDIVLVSYDPANYINGSVLRIVSGLDGAEIASVQGQNLQGTGGVACGDIDGDGIVEIISMTQTAVKAFEHDGTLKWTSSAISGHIYGTSDVAAISDMDGDGSPEIIAGRAILDANGSIVGTGSYGYGGVNGNNVGSCAFAVDVDGDGNQEVVVGNALYRKNGTAIWNNGQTDGYPAVADFDGDGQAEIAVSGNGKLRPQDTNGTVLWSQSIPGAGSAYYGGPPTVADYDGDGEPEIGVASGSRYSVFNADGTILWQAVTDDSSSGNTGSAVFDFEGDGVAEVVYADQTKLWVFNGVDGAVKLSSSEHSNGTWLEYPTIADVDGDGHAEIVVPNTKQYGSHSGIYVFGDADDSWRPGRKIWNQHAYSITNVNDDGTIPAHADLNWLSYNNFRSGDMTAGDGTYAPDLTLAQGDICEIDCDEDRLLLWINPGNEGAVDLSQPATIDVYARHGTTDTFLTSVEYTAGITVGTYADSIRIELSVADVADAGALVFVISSEDLECDETNNTLVWRGPFCE
ncbi:MAG: VCBS repeat-containing protein [Pseudomonadota bacterium]